MRVLVFAALPLAVAIACGDSSKDSCENPVRDEECTAEGLTCPLDGPKCPTTFARCKDGRWSHVANGQISPERLCGGATKTQGDSCDECAGGCNYADGQWSPLSAPPGGGVMLPTCGSDGTVTVAACTANGWALSTSTSCHPRTTPSDAGADG